MYIYSSQLLVIVWKYNTLISSIHCPNSKLQHGIRASPSNENPILTTHHPVSTPTSPIETPLIAFNISAQINEKLTPSTFPQWRAQFEALLIGYDLLDFVTGDHPCPSATNTSTSSSHKSHWVQQDKLILSAILASTTPTITPFISTAKT
jgi:hypothetical protein